MQTRRIHNTDSGCYFLKAVPDLLLFTPGRELTLITPVTYQQEHLVALLLSRDVSWPIAARRCTTSLIN